MFDSFIFQILFDSTNYETCSISYFGQLNPSNFLPGFTDVHVDLQFVSKLHLGLTLFPWFLQRPFSGMISTSVDHTPRPLLVLKAKSLLDLPTYILSCLTIYLVNKPSVLSHWFDQPSIYCHIGTINTLKNASSIQTTTASKFWFFCFV